MEDYSNQVGAACVALKKDFGKKGDERKVDIIFMPEESGAWSVRSVTELMTSCGSGKCRLKTKKECSTSWQSDYVCSLQKKRL